MNFCYAVVGLEEPGSLNVVSLEQETKVGCTFQFDRTGNLYRVLWCDKPQPTEKEAALLALKGETTLKVGLELRGPGVPVCSKHKTPMRETMTWDLREFQFFCCTEADCEQHYSVETGFVTASELPSRSY